MTVASSKRKARVWHVSGWNTDSERSQNQTIAARAREFCYSAFCNRVLRDHFVFREIKIFTAKLESCNYCKSDHILNCNESSSMEFGLYKNKSEDDRQDAGITENPKDQPDSSAEINMEFSITPDDIMRARGFGATDDISSVLPGASDSTDFENHLLDVWSYEEESEDKISKDNVESKDAFEAVNMEASVTSDEVVRAGGFGATDNISSFLPVASDFTDFEANLRDARDYEDSQEKISRPGLGWTSEMK